jgi:hypothetical protein
VAGGRDHDHAAADHRREGLVAFGLYLGASFLLFGLKLVPHFGSTFYGTENADPKTYAWFVEWWPHALWNLSNPLSPDVVAGPHPFNLVWAGASVPGPSVAMAPVTAAFGPLVGLNVWIVLGLALSAWGAYLLCRALGADRRPSLLGGFLFGFSSFAEHHTLHGHLNFTIAVGIPLAAWLVVRHLRGESTPRRFVLLLAAILVWQFLVSTEVFFTTTAFASLALVILIAVRWADRRALVPTLRRIALSYLIALVAVSPLLVEALTHIPNRRYLLSPARLSASPATFVLPKDQAQSYFGIGLIALVVLFAIAWRRRRGTWALVGGFALIPLLSMGPTLRIHGDRRWRLPWGGLWRLPFVRYTVPARLVVYAFLLAGIMAALWISAAPRRRARLLRWGLGVVCAAMIAVPYLTTAPGPSDPRRGIFADGTYRRFIAPGDTVVVLPYDKNVGMLWQAETRMGFRLVYPFFGVSLIRPYERTSPVLHDFRSLDLVPGSSPNLVRYLRRLGVREVVATGTLSADWLAVLDQLHAGPPAHDHGLAIYHLP